MQKYLEASKAPLLINSCETDTMFPIPAQEQTDALLGGGKFAPGYERTYWPGCVHGFAVRGDLVSAHIPTSPPVLTAHVSFQTNPLVKAGKEGAFKAKVEFLIKHL